MLGTSLTNQSLVSSEQIISGTSPDTGGIANTATRIELDAAASSTDGAYDPSIIYIVSGTGAGQSRYVWQYDGTNKYAYVNRDWKTIPDDTSCYIVTIGPGDTHVNEGKAEGGTNDTITLNMLASAQNNLYLGQIIFLVAGTGQDQARMCVGYDGATKVATVDANWSINPDATTIYGMLPYPGFVHGVPGADSAANVLTRDVVGNKEDVADDTADTASLVALIREIVAEVHEIYQHVHNVERWWGSNGAATETNAIAATVTVPFAATSGNDTWGGAIPICGTGDVPVLATQTEFDPHNILIVDLDDETDAWRLRLIWGTDTSAAAIAAGDWSEIMVISNAVPGNRAGGMPSEKRMPHIAVGSKMWAQAWNDTNGEIIQFFWGAHGYPYPP